MFTALFMDQTPPSPEPTCLNQSIKPLLSTEFSRGSILYLKSRHDTEASVRVSRTLEDSEIPLVINDPKETSIQALYWYGQQLWNARGVVTHFISSAREGFRIHNARYALISGLAAGFERDTLMLTEQSDMLSPMDYRDLMRH